MPNKVWDEITYVRNQESGNIYLQHNKTKKKKKKKKNTTM